MEKPVFAEVRGAPESGARFRVLGVYPAAGGTPGPTRFASMRAARAAAKKFNAEYGTRYKAFAFTLRPPPVVYVGVEDGGPVS